MPRELNLAPVWFHRLDADGEVLEWDCLWPILHYERTPEGGDDFRIRPLYRRVTEPEAKAVEHEFLWPFGRVRSDPDETSHRLFPLWSWRGRENDNGERDVDWYLIFPFLWGGASSDDRENYFAFLPFYADIPQFLTYDRFYSVLFPLYVRLDKNGHRHRLFLWPLIGTSSCAENGHQWFRILPFYGYDIEPGQHDRRFALWPFFAWSTENIDSFAVTSEDRAGPARSFWLWPFVGWRTGPTVGGWMVLWPFFQHTWKQDHFIALNLFWPLFHYYWNRAEDNVTQWWFWPFVSSVKSDDQRTWSLFWPLIWWREYDDPGTHTEQQWILPFFWHVAQELEPAGREDFVKVWPFGHRTAKYDGEEQRVGGDWSLLSPWPWRQGNATGMHENYGFLWELAYGSQRAPDDDALDVVGRLYTARERGGESTSSVPLLFNYERDKHGARTLRLFQFLPIPLGGGTAAATPEPER
ncbi:MAG TPA: hypothetical protein VFZ65_07140 [Planctomycetota bacterium]|nr:hypothetical protein [Planctomycetota bacterium]